MHRVVLCTSAMVYGALPDNDVPLAEDAELRATAEATGVGDLLEIERLGRRAPRAHPGLNVTVVRPAVLVGGTDTALTRYFESPRLLVVAGSPARLAVLPRRGPGQRAGVRRAGEGRGRAGGRLRRLAGAGGGRGAQRDPPHGAARPAVALGAAARLHRLGLTPSPGRGPRVHDAPLGGQRQPAARRRAGGPVDQRGGARGAAGGGRRAATRSPAGGSAARTPPRLGAAGATVALVGTAALVRRARKARAASERSGRRWPGTSRAPVPRRPRRGPGTAGGLPVEALFRDAGRCGTHGPHGTIDDHPGEQAAAGPDPAAGRPRHPAVAWTRSSRRSATTRRAARRCSSARCATTTAAPRSTRSATPRTPRAEAELRRVAEKVVADFPVRALAAVHRVGDLAVGDLAVVVAVSCPHRAEAFEACRKLIDDLKQRGADLEAPDVLGRHRGVGGRVAPRAGWGRDGRTGRASRECGARMLAVA